MIMNTWKLTIFFASVAFMYTSDAAITAWTEPVGSGADIDATAATTVGEDTANAASTGVTIQATGAGSVTYAIDSQETSGKLTIDTNTGVLTLAVGTFDYETAQTYWVVVVATDASDSTVGTATVTLSITDANDAPVFATEFGACIPDASGQGSSVVTVVATDQDSGDTITYSITAGDTNSHFQIDGSSGLVSVNTGVTLDASALAGYSLTITATDDGTGTLTDTTNLWIAVASSASAVAAGLLTLFVFLVSFL